MKAMHYNYKHLIHHAMTHPCDIIYLHISIITGAAEPVGQLRFWPDHFWAVQGAAILKLTPLINKLIN